MYKSLMVLGGTGFFGKIFLDAYLNESLIQYNINNLILVGNRFQEVKKILLNYKNKKKVFFLKKNLKNANKLPYADYIIYAAEYTSYEKILKNNNNKNDGKSLTNSFNILSKNIFLKSKIVYISSGAVYKNCKKKKKISENFELHSIKNTKLNKANEIYRNNKLIGEKKTLELSKNFNRKTSIIRCFTLIGKFVPLNKQYAVGNFINDALNKNTIKIESKNCKGVFRGYLHTNDLVKCTMNVICSADNHCEIYNVGNDKAISIWKLANYLSKKFNVSISYPKQQNKKINFYVADVRKIRNKFKINFSTNFKNLIDNVVKEIKA